MVFKLQSGHNCMMDGQMDGRTDNRGKNNVSTPVRGRHKHHQRLLLGWFVV